MLPYAVQSGRGGDDAFVNATPPHMHVVLVDGEGEGRRLVVPVEEGFTSSDETQLGLQY